MTEDNQTTKDDKVTDVLERMFDPKTATDKELLWVAVIAFAAGALIF